MENTHLKKLIDHLFWADAEVWKVVLNNEKSHSEEKIREALFHIHMVQDSFVHLWNEQVSEIPKNAAFEKIEFVRGYALGVHHKLHDFLDNLDQYNLNKVTTLPWSRYYAESIGKPIADTTLGDSIMQVIMHTTYHRGQINKQLRELDIKPPIVDFIVWLWDGQPDAKEIQSF